MVDILKNLLSLSAALLPLIEKYVELLPVNPHVRNDVWLISIMVAAVAGLGGYQSAKHLGRGRVVGWIGLLLFVLFLVVELAITTAGIEFGLPARGISLLVRVGYVLVFLSLGLAAGGFLGLS